MGQQTPDTVPLIIYVDLFVIIGSYSWMKQHKPKITVNDLTVSFFKVG